MNKSTAPWILLLIVLTSIVCLFSASEPGHVCDNVWDDLVIPGVGVNPPGGVGSATVDTTTPGILYSGSADQVCHFAFQMSHSKKVNTAIRFHIHGESTAVSPSTNAISWLIESHYRNNGSPNTYPWITNNVSVSYVTNMSIHGSVLLNAPANETMSSILSVKLTRLGTSDANNDDFRLISADCHFQKDGLGSDQEGVKSY